MHKIPICRPLATLPEDGGFHVLMPGPFGVLLVPLRHELLAVELIELRGGRRGGRGGGGGAVVLHREMDVVVLPVAQFEGLVGETQPEHLQ
jgi:hypothetical protein